MFSTEKVSESLVELNNPVNRLDSFQCHPCRKFRQANVAGVDNRQQGYLVLDNNLSERTLRAIALGRNNWGVIGSEVGGKTAAVLYSVVGT
ncbi:MAG: transposase, partial [Planctomycetes bacterium]|nr:transposase [Planctomycetota bacterium]